MSELALLHEVNDDPGSYKFWCPGCDMTHQIFTYHKDSLRFLHDGHPVEDKFWKFNGDLEKPTFEPSLMVDYGSTDKGSKTCHLVITDGKLYYQGDCYHNMAGQIIEMVPFRFGQI